MSVINFKPNHYNIHLRVKDNTKIKARKYFNANFITLHSSQEQEPRKEVGGEGSFCMGVPSPLPPGQEKNKNDTFLSDISVRFNYISEHC